MCKENKCVNRTKKILQGLKVYEINVSRISSGSKEQHHTHQICEYVANLEEIIDENFYDKYGALT